MFYKKKPLIIQAFHWTADENQEEDPKWMADALINGTCRIKKYGIELSMEIHTNTGVAIAIPGDYLILGLGEEIYPCKANVFEESYDVCNEQEIEIKLRPVKKDKNA